MSTSKPIKTERLFIFSRAAKADTFDGTKQLNAIVTNTSSHASKRPSEGLSTGSRNSAFSPLPPKKRWKSKFLARAPALVFRSHRCLHPRPSALPTAGAVKWLKPQFASDKLFPARAPNLVFHTRHNLHSTPSAIPTAGFTSKALSQHSARNNSGVLASTVNRTTVEFALDTTAAVALLLIQIKRS